MYFSALGITGISPEDCRARGGIPRVFYARYDQWGRGDESTATWSCDFPSVPSAPTEKQSAPITITVPTQVQTDISPQVSPQFIQQDEPRGSPISAGVTQATEASAFQEYLAQQAEREEMLQQELFRQLQEQRAAQPQQQLSPQVVYQDVPQAAPAQPIVMESQQIPLLPLLIAGVAGIAGIAYMARKKRKGT